MALGSQRLATLLRLAQLVRDNGIELALLDSLNVGKLVDSALSADVVDAVVVTTALRQKASILTSDPDDIQRLVGASGREIAVVAI